MNRFDFGTLVSSLRLELGWTQSELSEQTDLPLAVISNVERGERRGLLKDNILIKLARGLQLTTLERREFILAASGLGENNNEEPEDNPKISNMEIEALVNDLAERVGYLAMPCIVTDAYCDLIMINNSAQLYYHPTQSMLKVDPGQVGAYNQMRYVFHADSPFRELQGPDWEKASIATLRFFRRRTMRVRATRYFSDLMAHFRNEEEYPYFNRFYKRMLFDLQDDYFHEIQIPRDEKQFLYTDLSTLLASTPAGELYLHYQAPLNKHTADVFADLYRQAGVGVVRYSQFPDPRKN
jgi:transcriptional regulator with XRE-family HTH domain